MLIILLFIVKMYLIQTQNYVWDLKDVLGIGATGQVYKGNHNLTGDLVAVKTFNRTSKCRPLDVQMREFEVLKKVNHENIVKLLSIETTLNTNNKVIITELCSGGSLQNVLSDPKNTYGLIQSEFILVLKDLTAGLKYLRDNNIVHRDLKPGNIMKYISDDNQTIYKLADFGAARELENNNESFFSICGTDEYLHPAVFERAHIDPTNIDNKFTANYDLWSIGVTLYHIATGQLPFRPFGGRRNPKQMQILTSQKENDFISAVQYQENGPIVYSKELPKHCLLGDNFKKILTPLLRELLQAKPERMLTLEQYFEKVDSILNLKQFNIFLMNRLTLIDIFLQPNNRFEDLLLAIKAETNVQPENQILLYRNNYLVTKVGVNTEYKDYPNINAENPIFCYSADNNNVQIPEELDLPEFPNFSTNLSVENDAKTAHVTCSFAHLIQRKIGKYTTANVLLNSGVEQLIETYKYSLTNLIRKINNFETLLTTVIGLLERDTNNDSINDELEILIKKCKLLKSEFENVTKPAEILFNKNVNENLLSEEWKKTIENCKNWPLQYRSNQRANTLFEGLLNSWKKLIQDKEKESLTYEEAQFNSLEKNKINENVKRLKLLLNDNVEPAVKQMYNYFADWYKKAQVVYVQLQILNKDFMDINNKYREIYDNLYEMKINKKNEDNQSFNNQNQKKELLGILVDWSKIQNDTRNTLKEHNELNLELKKIQENFQHIFN